MCSFTRHENDDLKQTRKTDMTLLKNALTFTMFTDGIPFIYYGTEQGFQGGDDPLNREPLWASRFNRDAEIYKFLRLLNRIRSQVDSSFFDALHTHIYTTNNVHVSFFVVVGIAEEALTPRFRTGLQKRKLDHCCDEYWLC